jgi:hypothetical protein
VRIIYRSLRGYKYELLETYELATTIWPKVACRLSHLELLPNGKLTIYVGYAWDGPSGPTVDTKNFMRGSLVHDALYQLIRQGALPAEARAPADQLLRQLCREDGMSAIRAWWVYAAVRAAGWLATSRRVEGQDEVHEAP